MGQKSFDWESFFDLATTTEAARALDAMYGQGAARAAIKCALAAKADERGKDLEFWIEVLEQLTPRQAP